jgi:hypothetical protein
VKVVDDVLIHNPPTLLFLRATSRAGAPDMTMTTSYRPDSALVWRLLSTAPKTTMPVPENVEVTAMRRVETSACTVSRGKGASRGGCSAGGAAGAA